MTPFRTQVISTYCSALLFLHIFISMISVYVYCFVSGFFVWFFFFFFFQAEDGIRDTSVTGVQTCALPISCSRIHERMMRLQSWSLPVAAALILLVTMGGRQTIGLFIAPLDQATGLGIVEIGRAHV